MKRFKFMIFTLVFAITFLAAISNSSLADIKDEHATINGNIVCLLPDYKTGSVNPVIATAPCDGYPPHHHVVVTDDAVYSLQGLQDGLKKIEKNPKRTNIEIAGKVQGSEQTGWVLFVN